LAFLRPPPRRKRRKVTEEVNEKVLALVERELKKDPSIQSAELKAKASKIDKSIAELSGRQFHARYALQIRRRLFGRTGSRGRRKRGRPSASSGEVQRLVTTAYEERRVRLDAAIERAFGRAIESGSFGKVSKFLAALDRHVKELEKA
jgi:hypothetical protein